MSKPKTQTSPHELTPNHERGRRIPQVPRSSTSFVQRSGHRGSDDGDEAAPFRFLTGPAVCQRYNVSDMSIWRWLRDPTVNFPKPALIVRGRRYWAESDLVNWERGYIPYGDDAVPPRRSAEPKAVASST